MVELFAYQETLLIMAVFGIAILAMLWVGFRRWLQHKQNESRLIAEEAKQFGAQMERVEARLKSVEQILTDRGVQDPVRIDAVPNTPLPDPDLKHDQV